MHAQKLDLARVKKAMIGRQKRVSNRSSLKRLFFQQMRLSHRNYLSPEHWS
jgi:hypothetical protein